MTKIDIISGFLGAGKTTFMNLLTDNLQRTSGEILFEGEDIIELGKSFRANIGYMPQTQGFYEQFSPVEFLKYIGKLKGLKGKEYIHSIGYWNQYIKYLEKNLCQN